MRPSTVRQARSSRPSRSSLTDLLVRAPAFAGATRLSARSFPRWQNDFTQIANGLGGRRHRTLADRPGPARLTGAYLPSPALDGRGGCPRGARRRESRVPTRAPRRRLARAGACSSIATAPERIGTAVRVDAGGRRPGGGATRDPRRRPLGPELQTRIVDRAAAPAPAPALDPRRAPRQPARRSASRLFRVGGRRRRDLVPVPVSWPAVTSGSPWSRCAPSRPASSTHETSASLAPARALLTWSLGP
jgi:hypothetical protein